MVYLLHTTYVYIHTYICAYVHGCMVNYCMLTYFDLQFGGKLVSFGPSAPTTVSISQVTTEVDFVERSEALQSALGQGDFSGYCAMKMENASTKQEKNIWEFMKVCPV